MNRGRPFGGGFRFRRHAGQPAAETSATGVPRNVVTPMLQGYDIPVEPLVREGDSVYAGQVIGRDDSIVSSPVDLRIHRLPVNPARTAQAGTAVRRGN